MTQAVRRRSAGVAKEPAQVGGALACAARCRCRRRPASGSTSRFADPPQRQQGRHRQNGGHEEYGLCRHEIAAGAHDAGGKTVADRGEARIAAQPRAHRCVADQTERNGGDGRAQDRAGGDVQQLRRDNRREHWRHRDQERADAYADNGERSRAPFRARPIDQPAAGHLAQQAREAADGEDQADVDLRPFLGRQIDREEGTEAGLDVGNEEGEPVEPALACL